MSAAKPIAIFCLLLAIGCSNEPEPVKTKVELLTEQPWVYWTAKARMSDLDTWRDLPFSKPDGTLTVSTSRCVEDDITTFQVDGVLLRDQGNTFCSGSTIQVL